MSDRPVKLILVDDDYLWRLGLRTALTGGGNLQEDSPEKLQVIGEAAQLTEIFGLDSISAPDVLILGIKSPSLDQLWQPCQQLQQKFPNLNILLLSNPLAPEVLSQARERGIKGYCRRSEAIDTIVTAINQVAEGESFWSSPLNVGLQEQQINNKNLTLLSKTTFLYSQAITGVGQIDKELEKINRYLQQAQISNFSWLFWTGRKRELLTARWLINQLLPLEITNLSTNISINESILNQNDSNNSPPDSSSFLVFSEINNQIIDQSITINNAREKIYNLVKLQIENNLFNGADNSLEINILSFRKKQDLLSLILEEFISLCQDLSLSLVDQEYIIRRKKKLLQDLWESVIINFFGKYSSLKVGMEEQEIVAILLLDAVIIQEEILEKIPFVEELLSQILFGTNLTIDDISYPGESGEAIARAELILGNLIIQVANAVLQPLLNRFSEVETIKLAFYDQRLLSARDITKFRNDLSWKYRLDNYFYEPKLIFESSYKLYVFSESGIRTTQVYAPRTLELQSLTGVRYFVTLWLELKDAIAPRLKTLTSFLGQGLVYVLTQIIGRGMGLIGKGILQGIGNSLQEARAGRDRAK